MVDAVLLEPLEAPIPRTRLIGRDTERQLAHRWLIDDMVPLLTITGPGGVGKTRIALAIAGDVAEHFTDGVAWIDLAPLRDPTLVPIATATALGLTTQPDRPVIADLARHLRSKQMLLLFDNCEHVLEGAAWFVGDLLARCPVIQILASSRAPLRVRGEQVLMAEPLPVPAGASHSSRVVEANEAIQLFVERAQAIRPSFQLTDANAAAVTQICRALDGLPLAIELATARITIFSPDALLEQMTHRLSLLRDGPRNAPMRQQTITATIGWSYDLLTPDTQALFRRMTVFSGGFTLEALQAVAGESANHQDIVGRLSTLVEHSLVVRMDRDDAPRFTTLETIREFGLARLAESGDEAAARTRHATYYLQLVESLDAWVAAFLPNAQEILDHLELELPNLRAALAWQRESGNAAGLVQLAAGLVFLWQLRSHLHEGRSWLEWGLAQPVQLSASARANGQLALATVLQVLEGAATSLPLCEESLRVFQSHNDAPRIARAFQQAAASSLALNDADRTTRYIDAALQALGTLDNAAWTERATCHVLWIQSIRAKDSGDLVGAERYLRELIARQRMMATASGKAQLHACGPFLTLGAIQHCQNDLEAALDSYQTSLDHAWRFQVASTVAVTTARIAGMVAGLGRWQEAAWLFGATEAYCDTIDYDFRHNVWRLTRAFGLPQPWQEERTFASQAAAMWAATVRRLPNGLPSLPDPDAANKLWQAGRSLPMADAVAHALAVDLVTNRDDRPMPVVAKLDARAAVVKLTPREQEVLAMLCQRLTNAEMADRLSLSRRTIEDHVTGVLGKLNVANRREAAALAVRNGLTARDSSSKALLQSRT